MFHLFLTLFITVDNRKHIYSTHVDTHHNCWSNLLYVKNQQQNIYLLSNDI